MFRLLKLFCEIWAVIFITLALLIVLVLFSQNSDTVVLTGLQDFLTQLLGPLANVLKDYLHLLASSLPASRHWDSAYSYLAAFLIFIFIIGLFLSAVFNKLQLQDERRMRHHLENKTRKQMKALEEKEQKSYAQTYGELETTTYIAMSLTHYLAYPGLYEKLNALFASLLPTQCIFSEADRTLLQFESILAADQFARSITSLFSDFLASPTMISEDNYPFYRIAMHTLPDSTGLFREEQFIWTLLKCVPPNTILLSEEARERLVFDAKPKKLEPETFKITAFGTFANMGHRSRVNIFMLELQSP